MREPFNGLSRRVFGSKIRTAIRFGIQDNRSRQPSKFRNRDNKSMAGCRRLPADRFHIPQRRDASRGIRRTDCQGTVERVVCLSSSYIAMFDALGKVENVVGVSGMDFISNEYVTAHRNRIGDVGYDSNIDFEMMLAMRPDVVLLYGIAGEETRLTSKLGELGIPYMYMGDYVENSPLGKAEWIHVVAELTDRCEEADSLFGRITDDYEELAEKVRTHLSGQHGKMPQVMLNTPYRDIWFMPSAESYMVRLIRDAGGETYTPAEKGSASIPVDLEKAYLLASEADVWLNTGRQQHSVGTEGTESEVRTDARGQEPARIQLQPPTHAGRRLGLLGIGHSPPRHCPARPRNDTPPGDNRVRAILLRTTAIADEPPQYDTLPCAGRNGCNTLPARPCGRLDTHTAARRMGGTDRRRMRGDHTQHSAQDPSHKGHDGPYLPELRCRPAAFRCRRFSAIRLQGRTHSA